MLPCNYTAMYFSLGPEKRPLNGRVNVATVKRVFDSPKSDEHFHIHRCQSYCPLRAFINEWKKNVAWK